MKKLIAFAALATLASTGLADNHAATEKSCCGSCKKEAAVEKAEGACSKEATCKKEKAACSKKTEACSKKAEACEKAAE